MKGSRTVISVFEAGTHENIITELAMECEHRVIAFYDEDQREASAAVSTTMKLVEFGCVVGDGSIVVKDVPAGSIVAGVPVQVYKPVTQPPIGAKVMCKC